MDGQLAKRESVILGGLPELSGAILELPREHGPMTVQEGARITGASRNTVKDHLKLLTEQVISHCKGLVEMPGTVSHAHGPGNR